MSRIVVSAVVLPTTPGLKSFTASKAISAFQETPGGFGFPGFFMSIRVADHAKRSV
jgi:hypothetical protein